MNIILIELNEINFDIVNNYIKSGETLNNLDYIINNGLTSTSSENEYELLEPWIQWPSVHLGKSFKEHNIFRLGDIIKSEHQQLFEKIENRGFEVGAISPMNADNKLKKSKYFIPDPWTKTRISGNYLIRSLSKAISQAVNDNSQSKLKISSLLSLLACFLVFVPIKKWLSLLSYAISTIQKPWRKAIFLDLFLHEIHKTLIKKYKVNFTTIFFNAGAHIQHHYFFNSGVLKNNDLENPSWYIQSQDDPLLDLLKIYDRIMGDYLKNLKYEVVIATGLSQKPYNRVKFYYRLTNHEAFLQEIGIYCRSVIPRMTRDFLLVFNDNESTKNAENVLNSIKVNDEDPLFNEIDNRGNELFVTLTYPDEISVETFIKFNERKIYIKKYVTFVAIKNGMHDSKGFSFFSDGIKSNTLKDGDNVLNLHNSILNCFS